MVCVGPGQKPECWFSHAAAHMKFLLVFDFIFLAHLSPRLIGELIEYPCSGVLRLLSVCRSTISNISSETAWPINGKFYVEPPWVGESKVCSRHLGHMTEMVAMPIYENPS